MEKAENEKAYALFGLIQKAGKLKSGEWAVEKSIGGLKARLVILATDASENSKKQYRDKCAFYEVPCIEFGTKERLGRAIGKEERSALSVEDEGLAATLKRKIDGGNTNGEN